MAVLAGLIIAVLGLSFATALSSHSQTIPISSNLVLLETLIALVCMIVAVAAIGYFTIRSITRPLQELSTLTRRIANGDTKARANLSGHDEIYLIATSMNNMLDNIVHLIQETQSQHDTLQAQVEKLVSEVSGVGEGDLGLQAEVTADALGVLADSFNYMVEELASLVVRVKMVASEVEHSTAAILDRMTQLVENGDNQINQIADAVIEVEHMAAASHQVAERSQVLYRVARIARQDAQIGRTSLMQAIEGMGHIDNNVQATASKVQTLGERSRQINDVVEAIQSITHQTNRLALDAAIQAAMAGSNGKGFGAVAADIRRLAERSKEQADTIAQIVRSIREDIGAVAISMQETQRETATGTKLTQEAGIALESIFAAVEHQAREIENINQMGMQQLQSSSTIVQIMHTVSESTQQAGLSTREASQNMERLARLVEQLRASVEAFKLRENQGHKAYTDNSAMDNLMNSQTTTSNALRTVTATARTIYPSGADNTGSTTFSPRTNSFTHI
jgi:methyl-accepting chemotaxis protein